MDRLRSRISCLVLSNVLILAALMGGIMLVGCGGGGGGGIGNSGGGSQPPSPTITSVSATCASATVPTEKTLQCSATVAGTGSYSSNVSWSVSGASGGNSTVGTISAAGLYTAPNTVPTPYTVSVTATSAADSKQSASFSVTVAGTIASVTEPISSASGGTITLPDGSSVTIAAGVLPADQSVTLSEVSYVQQQPPNKSISAVGPGLVLMFASPIPATASRVRRLQTGARRAVQNTSVGTQLPFAFSINVANNNVSELNGSVPIVDFLDSSNNSTFMGGLGNYDSTTSVITDNVGADQWQSILSVAASTLQSIIVSAGNTATSLAGDIYNVFTAPHRLSLSIVSRSSQDTWGDYTTCPVGKTLLVVHGMNDYVEQGFSTGTNGNPPIIQAIVNAGKYQSALGFDYNWTQGINTSGGQLADFLNTVTVCPGISLDIEAHSEGVAVSLSAISLMNSSQRGQIKHVIGLGGPIMGTPMASDPRDLAAILMAMPVLNIGDNVVINGFADLLTNSFVGDLQPSTPGSGDTLDGIRSSLSAASANNSPQIIVVAGESAQAASGALGQVLRVCGAILQTQGATYSDGFIPVTSALAFQPSVQPGDFLTVYPLEPFQTDHLDLIKCGDGVPNEDPCTTTRSIVSSVGSDVSNAFVPPTLEISNTLQCSSSVNSAGNLVCSSSPGSSFLLNGSGYSSTIQNSGWKLDSTGDVTSASAFLSPDGAIPHNYWIEQTTCGATSATTLMFFAQEGGTQQPSNAVSEEIAAGRCATPSITVSPSSAEIAVTQTEPFSVDAMNISSSVLWSVNGMPGGNSTSGTISTTGFYTAPSIVPSPSTATISATSQVDSKISGSAMITISVPGTVIVIPSSVTVPAGSVQTFSATVTGGGTVTWNVEEGASGGSITSTGTYAAPTQTGTYHVAATNSTDPSESATATVNVVAGPSITTLHSFNHATEGAIPWSTLTLGTDGNLYGTTEAGGDLSCEYISSLQGCGTLFKSDISGNVTTLHTFSGQDGAYPTSALDQTTSSTFYGNTDLGGANTSQCDAAGTSTPAGCGTVFSFDLVNGFATVYSFGPYNSALGIGPTGGLTQSTNKTALFGANEVGGNSNCTGALGSQSYTGCGSIFTITGSNQASALHTFSGSDGAFPASAPIQLSDGNLYGVTSGGGTLTCSSYASPGCGTVYTMNPTTESFTTLHSFNTSDGADPYPTLIQGSDGSLYGVTLFGGSTACSGGAKWQGCGTVFKIGTGGSFEPLHSFSGPDGAYPAGGLLLGSDGYFYGTTQGGGDASCSGRYGPGCGTVFKMDASGNVTVLYSFTGQSDGSWPESSLIQGADGTLYGTTAYGGANDDGVIFKISNLTALATSNSAKALFAKPEIERQVVMPRSVTRPHIAPPGPAVPPQH